MPTYVFYSQIPPTKVEGRKHTVQPLKEVQINGGQAPRHRKEIIITNRNASLRLQLRRAGAGTSATEDLNDNEFIATLFPNETFRMETNATLWVRNGNDAGSGPITFNVAEVYYDPPV